MCTTRGPADIYIYIYIYIYVCVCVCVCVPMADKQSDPLFNQKFTFFIDGAPLAGFVDDVEVGKVSRERLYRIRYADDDLQHMTSAMLRDLAL